MWSMPKKIHFQQQFTVLYAWLLKTDQLNWNVFKNDTVYRNIKFIVKVVSFLKNNLDFCRDTVNIICRDYGETVNSNTN